LTGFEPLSAPRAGVDEPVQDMLGSPQLGFHIIAIVVIIIIVIDRF